MMLVVTEILTEKLGPELEMEAVTDFINIFMGSKITVDGDCTHEIKRCLLLITKTMTNLDSVSKSRVITFQQVSI